MTEDHFPTASEDVPGRAVGLGIAGTALTVICCAVIVAALSAFHVYGGGESKTFEVPKTRIPPAEPFDTSTLIEGRRALERQALDSWTWADERARTVRLPIEIAIDRYLERGQR